LSRGERKISGMPVVSKAFGRANALLGAFWGLILSLTVNPPFRWLRNIPRADGTPISKSVFCCVYEYFSNVVIRKAKGMFKMCLLLQVDIIRDFHIT
jgi:hypothetical protein